MIDETDDNRYVKMVNKLSVRELHTTVRAIVRRSVRLSAAPEAFDYRQFGANVFGVLQASGLAPSDDELAETNR